MWEGSLEDEAKYLVIHIPGSSPFSIFQRESLGTRLRSSSLDGRVQRLPQLDLLRLLLSSLHQSEVLHDGDPGVLGQLDGCLVTHPAVDATATTVHPQEVTETKVLCVCVYVCVCMCVRVCE